MQQSGFAARIAKHLGRPVEAACAVRPPYTTITMALCAGLGAGIGSVLGGTLGAGAGGGLGALVGILVNWLRLRPGDFSLAMALVLGSDRLELLRLTALGTRPVGTIRSIPYADVTDVDVSEGPLELRIALRTRGERIDLKSGRGGVGAAPAVIEELRRRIAA